MQHLLLPYRCRSLTAAWRQLLGASASLYRGKVLDVNMSASTKKDPGSEYKLGFLRHDAASATDEPVDTEIVGEVPEWLEGSLYRNGPGIFKVGDTRLRHLFDGFAILHQFHMSKGKVTYRSRVLDTDTWVQSVKANRLVATQFGTFETPDPCKTRFSKVMSFFKATETTDNTSVNIVEHGDRLYALTETPWMVRVDPHTLRKAGAEDLSKTIAVHLSTAHPHFDSEGNMYNLGTYVGPRSSYSIIKFPVPTDSDTEVTPQAKLLKSLKSRWKTAIGYNHSFGMSRDHFVILEQPVAINTLQMATSFWRESSVIESFSKYPEKELSFKLVRRSDNKEVPIKYHAETTFTFHFVNCFEDEGQLVVDFCGYPSLDVLDDMYLERLDSKGHITSLPTFRRYVLPLSLDQAKEGENLVRLPYTSATATLMQDGKVFLTPDLVIEGGVSMDLPRINYEKANAKKYRYVYGTRIFTNDPALVKVDLQLKETTFWRDEGFIPGEPVFVPSPGATREDDGVILSPVLGSQDGESCYLLILDATTFQELARARTPAQVKMPVTFHGTYVSREK